MEQDPEQSLAWLALQQAAAVLKGELSGRLEASAGMSASEFDVLWYLSNAVDRRLTMSELAARAMLGRSGATRLVDRLVRRGWVDRAVAEDNRRTVYAALTPAGARATRTGYRTAVGARQELLGERLERDDVAALRRVLGKLLHRLDIVQ